MVEAPNATALLALEDKDELVVDVVRSWLLLIGIADNDDDDDNNDEVDATDGCS
jgi:hypothetical protein